jgi:RNA exonuclease 4
MAVYRLHRKEWEKGNKQLAKHGESGKKRKRHKNSELKGSEAHSDEDSEGEEVKVKYPGGGRKGVSSGLTTVVRRGANSRNREVQGSGNTGEKKNKWWKDLASGSKETLRFRKLG